MALVKLGHGVGVNVTLTTDFGLVDSNVADRELLAGACDLP